MRQSVIRSSLEALYFSGAYRLRGRLHGGVGAILALHHVRPARDSAFQPNRALEVTPQFLDDALGVLRRQGVELISVGELHARLWDRDFRRRFVCLTFDDGYRDIREWAYPILKRHNVPFAIYVPTSFPDRQGDLWWLTLEAVIAARDHVEIPFDNGLRRVACRTTAEKYAAARLIHRALCALSDEERLRTTVAAIAARAGVEPGDYCTAFCMTWRQLSELAADPLVTIGAHTVSHPRLRRLREADARREMVASVARIEATLGVRPMHFSYPYGDPIAAGPREFALARELGFKTAVTTRPGALFPQHRDHLMALPRISLNGEFQRLRYLKVLTSGAATALSNQFRRVNAT